MPCACTTNALRVFIRSVARFDSYPFATYKTRALLGDSATRNITTGQPHFQCLPPNRNDTSLLPTVVSSNTNISIVQESTKTQQSPIASRRLRDNECDRDFYSFTTSQDLDTDSAFVDLSPQSIDALLAEPVYNPTSKEQRSVSGPVSRTTVRRTKVPRRGLTLHFSAPRAPLRTPTPPVHPRESISAITHRSKVNKKDEWVPPRREPWQAQKAALEKKFPDGWNPLKRLSPDALSGIRALHDQMPEQYTTSVLAATFQVSPEAIRKILKSKWTPKATEETDRQRRWFKRGEKVWSRYAELGVKPPRKWRDIGVGKGKPERKKSPVLTTTKWPGHLQRPDGGAGLDSLADRIL